MEKEIDIIDNYRSLPIGDYQDIVGICKNENLGELDKQVGIIAILTGKSEEEILDLPINDYKRLAAKTAFLAEGLPESKKMVAKCYTLSRFELIPVMDIREVTTAQYIDFQSFHQAGLEEHFVEILSTILVPKGKKYNQDYNIIELQTDIREGLSVQDAVSLYASFILSCRESMKDTLTFSLQEAKKIKDKTKREETERKLKGLMTLL